MADVYWSGYYQTDIHAAASDNNFMNGNIYLGIYGDGDTEVFMTCDPGTTFLFVGDAVFRGQEAGNQPSFGTFTLHGDVDNPVIFREDPTTFPQPVYLTVGRCQAMFEANHKYDWKYVIQRYLSQWGGWIGYNAPKYSFTLSNSLQYRCMAAGRAFYGIPTTIDTYENVSENLMHHTSHLHVDHGILLDQSNVELTASAGPCSAHHLWFSMTDLYTIYSFQRVNKTGMCDISGTRISDIYICEDCKIIGGYFENRKGVGTWPPLKLPPYLMKDIIIDCMPSEVANFNACSPNIDDPTMVLTPFYGAILYNYNLAFNNYQISRGGSPKGSFFYKLDLIGDVFLGIRAWSGNSTTECSGASVDCVYAYGWNRLWWHEDYWIGQSNPPYQCRYTTNLTLSNSSDSPIYPLATANVVATPATSSVTITFDCASGPFGDRQWGLPVVKYGTISGIYTHRAGQYERSDLGLINAQVQFDWDGNQRHDLAGIEFKKTGHSITIGGLSPGTTYYFVAMIQSLVDRIGDEDGTEYSFTTESAPSGGGGVGGVPNVGEGGIS